MNFLFCFEGNRVNIQENLYIIFGEFAIFVFDPYHINVSIKFDDFFS